MAVIRRGWRTGDGLGGIVDLIEAGPPFARNERALVVISDVDDPELEFSFLDQVGERFIGTGAWSGEPVFHRARRTTAPDGRAGYLVGPEVTRRLRLNASFRIATRTGLSADIASKVRTFEGSASGGEPAPGPDSRASAPPLPPSPVPAPVSAGLPPSPAALPAALPLPGSAPVPLHEPASVMPLPLPGTSAASPAPIAAGVVPLPLPPGSSPTTTGPVLQPLPIPTPPPQRSGLARLLPWLLLLAGAIVAFFAIAPLEWQLQVCRYAPEIGPCAGAPSLAGIAPAGLDHPCEQASAFERWLAAHPGSRFRPLAERRRAEAEAACRATPVPTPPQPPQPPRPPRRSDNWLRCERLMAPSWDPASPPGARADNPTRADGEAALPVCQAALAEAAGQDRAVALFRLGRAQQFAGRRAEARQIYADAVAAGSAAAAYALGLVNFNDQPPSHYREAVADFEIAVRAGIARAKAALAGLLNAGEGGVPADYPRAVRLAREAVDENVGFGARVLGQLYEDGHGVAVNHAEACRWFARGAELGDDMSRTIYSQRCR